MAGCSPAEIKVTVDVINGKATAKFQQNGGFLISRPGTPCIAEIKLIQALPGGEQAIRWEAKAPDSVQCVDLAQLKIGTAPKGFQEMVPYKSQGIPTQFILKVDGIGSGEAEFLL